MIAPAAKRQRRCLRGGSARPRLRAAWSAPLAAALMVLATPVFAQAYQCRVDNVPVSVRPLKADGPTRKMRVTGYTLALSWAPEYCKGRESRSSDATQCSGQHGRFGLVVHGLWPEGGDGRWPQWCGSPRQLTPQTVRRVTLQARQWAKHGSCMASTPEAYFRATQALWRSVEPRLPDLDLLSRRKGLNAGRLREAFVAANPAWKPEQIGIDRNQRGWLEEIRLCYGRDFLPTRCSRSQYGAPDKAEVKIWRGL